METKTFRYISMVAALVALSALSCGARLSEFSEETYGPYDDPIIEETRCGGFGENCTFSWTLAPGFGNREVGFILYRAPLGSNDYEIATIMFLTGEQDNEKHEYAYTDSGLSVSDENRVYVYKYRLEVTVAGKTQQYGPMLYRAGYHEAEPANCFLGPGVSPDGKTVELGVVSDREQEITCDITPADGYYSYGGFYREIGPGDYVYRWEKSPEPGEYVVRIPMIGWGDQSFENKFEFTLK